jgi:hypothetical protein
MEVSTLKRVKLTAFGIFWLAAALPAHAQGETGLLER